MELAKAKEIIEALHALYPDARAELNFTNPFETLIATILSAQCTDKRVNMVTAQLFPKFPDAAAFAALTPDALEPHIKECGLYHSKAANIVAACRMLVELYGGQVPQEREKLMALPGVGRKTAGVVRLAAFGLPEIPVDTHVFRVSRRIGLADAENADCVEAQLRALLPEESLVYAHHCLIWHGRRMCHARKPECEACPLNDHLCAKNYL